MWEILSRETPWSNLDTKGMLTRVILEQGRPRIPVGVGCSMENLIRACWAQNPRLRPTFALIKGILSPMQNVGSGGG